MASGKRIECWLLLLVLLCVAGCMEAKIKAPRSALLFDPLPVDANGKGTSIPGVVGVSESQSVPLEEAELGEEGRILLGSATLSSTTDYSPPSWNHDHDKGGHHP